MVHNEGQVEQRLGSRMVDTNFREKGTASQTTQEKRSFAAVTITLILSLFLYFKHE